MLTDNSYKHIFYNFSRELSKFVKLVIQSELSYKNEKPVATQFFMRVTWGKYKLKLNERTFVSVTSTKNLGAVLDGKLSFTSHIDYIYYNMSKHVGILNILSTSAPLFIFKWKYYAL